MIDVPLARCTIVCPAAALRSRDDWWSTQRKVPPVAGMRTSRAVNRALFRSCCSRVLIDELSNVLHQKSSLGFA